MAALFFIGLLVYAVRCVYINLLLEDAAQKAYGVLRPFGTPNYLARVWGWGIVALFSALKTGIF